MLDIEPHIFLLRVGKEVLTAALVAGPVLLGMLSLMGNRRGQRSKTALKSR